MSNITIHTLSVAGWEDTKDVKINDFKYVDIPAIYLHLSSEFSFNFEIFITVLFRNQKYRKIVEFSVDDDEYCPPEIYEGRFQHKLYVNVDDLVLDREQEILIQVTFLDQIIWNQTYYAIRD
jgi:hypothetical protein